MCSQIWPHNAFLDNISIFLLFSYSAMESKRPNPQVFRDRGLSSCPAKGTISTTDYLTPLPDQKLIFFIDYLFMTYIFMT